MKTKRGIEPVIATVLLIVITIAVVGVLVAFLYPYINGMTEKETACRNVRLEIDSSGTCTNYTTSWIMVSYVTGTNDKTRISVQATAQGATKSNDVQDNLLKISEADTYMIKVGNATKVGAVPYVMYNGKEYMCDGGKVELISIKNVGTKATC